MIHKGMFTVKELHEALSLLLLQHPDRYVMVNSERGISYLTKSKGELDKFEEGPGAVLFVESEDE